MSRGDKILAADIMPRHLRRADVQTAITLPPGATLADTRRQLVLRAFASANGDYARAATLVGMTPAEVRAEMAALLNGNSGEHQSTGSATNGAQKPAKPSEPYVAASKPAKAPVKASAAPPPGKSKAKKR
jgi:hypothetical protein